jgi:predicted transcriptional regulator
MSKAVKVPDPVYEKLSTAAENQDVARGVIVREWMEKAEKWEQTSQGRNR